MKLSQLVTLRHKLEQLFTLSDATVKDALTELVFDTEKIQKFVSVYPFNDDIDAYTNKLIEIIFTMNSSRQQVLELISTCINEIDIQIEKFAEIYYTRGYIINDAPAPVSVTVDNEDSIRVLPLDENSKDMLINVIRGYTDWQYPTLEIGPGRGVWTEHLIAGDPLYIVDIRQEYLNSTLSKFNDVYRRRVRPYLIKQGEGDKFADLSDLPQNQFGFIFSWNVFNYFTLYESISYLRESYKALRPGGVMMFSYNNCEVPICAYNVEVGFKSWMTKKLLTKICTDLGFEIIDTGSIPVYDQVHWIEIKKPGKLRTVKTHQVLGRIVPV